MNIRFITDQRAGEPDILQGVRHEALTVRDLDGGVAYHQLAPAQGWTHDALCSLEIPAWCADAYLGEVWVGSTEI